MKLIIFIALTAISTTCASSEWESFSYKKITFDQSGYPEDITVLLNTKDPNLAAKLVQCVFITEDEIVYCGVMNPEVKHTNGRLDGIQVTVSTDTFRGSKYIDSNNPSEWKMAEITGRKIPIGNNIQIIPFVVSKDYIIGIALNILNKPGEEFLRKLERHKKASDQP